MGWDEKNQHRREVEIFIDYPRFQIQNFSQFFCDKYSLKPRKFSLKGFKSQPKNFFWLNFVTTFDVYFTKKATCMAFL